MTTYGTNALEALADPTRRSIFERLGSGPQAVTDLASNLPISRPAVSQHLKVLLDAQLVSVRAHGTRRIYALDPTGLRAVRAYFERFWTAALSDFAAAAEAFPEAEPPTYPKKKKKRSKEKP
ncbi:MAG TPA: metalloregulator ArsR/SmtB family transcription factor [Jatrophihabitantaceae bacterium]|nr:metalloregulator ArsR/SmtB family transcription factor [Jatrophihabitantaceae bacterium]